METNLHFHQLNQRIFHSNSHVYKLSGISFEQSTACKITKQQQLYLKGQRQKFVESNIYFKLFPDYLNYGNGFMHNPTWTIQPIGTAKPDLSLNEIYKNLNQFDVVAFCQNALPDALVDQSQAKPSKEQSDFFQQNVKYSLFFLYFMIKSYNQYLEQSSSKLEIFQQIKWFQTQIMQIKCYSKADYIKFATANSQSEKKSSEGQHAYKLIPKHPILRSQINKLCRLLKIYHNPPQEHFNILKCKQIQTFLLYKLYTVNQIQNSWTQNYLRRLQKLTLSAQHFLRDFQFQLQQFIIPDSQTITKKINDLLQIYKESQFDQPSNAVISILNFLINNLKGFNSQSLYKTQDLFDFLDKFSSVEDFDKILIKRSPNWYRDFSLVSCQNGLAVTRYSKNGALYLYQVENSRQLFQNPQFFYQNLFKAAFGYFSLFKLCQDQKIRVKAMLLPLSLKHLIWNPSQKSIEVDKLQILRLLLGLEGNSMSFQSAIAFQDQHKLDAGLIIQQALRSLAEESHHEIQFIAKQFLNIQKQRNVTSLTYYSQSIPFLNMIVAGFEIFCSNIDNFQLQIDFIFHKGSLESNLRQFLIQISTLLRGKQSVIFQKQLCLTNPQSNFWSFAGLCNIFLSLLKEEENKILVNLVLMIGQSRSADQALKISST